MAVEPARAGPGPIPPRAEPALGVGRAEDAPQETFPFRENAVALAPRQLEFSLDLSYLRNAGFLQLDRALVAAAAVRLGVLPWLELGLTVPAYTAARSRSVGPFQSRLRETGGVGDVALQANARLHQQTASTPGVVLSLGAAFPTGAEPFDFTFYQPDPALPAYNPNPTDLTASYFSRGAWELRTNLQVYKTVDPVILFAGAGLLHAFPQRAQGFEVQQGLTYTYNFGFSFALSERSTLGFQVNGAFRNKLRVDGRRVPGSNLEPVAVRLSLVQRLFQNTFLEPSVTAGLTDNAPSLGIGLGVRQRF